MANIGWGQGEYGQNRWGGQLDVSASPSGLEATGAVSSVTAFASFIIPATGVSATGSVGTAVASIPISFGVTGVSATIGFMTGWGNDAWSAGVWGGGVAAIPGQDVVPTAAVATGSVGTVVLNSNWHRYIHCDR